MRSIKSRFNKIKSKNPFLGSCIIFAEAVKGQRFTQSSITREFSQLVPKDEYDKKERRGVIKFLTEISNVLEDDIITSKNDTGNELKELPSKDTI